MTVLPPALSPRPSASFEESLLGKGFEKLWIRWPASSGTKPAGIVHCDLTRCVRPPHLPALSRRFSTFFFRTGAPFAEARARLPCWSPSARLRLVLPALEFQPPTVSHIQSPPFGKSLRHSRCGPPVTAPSTTDLPLLRLRKPFL